MKEAKKRWPSGGGGAWRKGGWRRQVRVGRSGDRPRGLRRVGWWALVGTMVPWLAGPWGGGPPIHKPGSGLGVGYRDPKGKSAGEAYSPVLVSVGFRCFCPQPRFWPQWPCTVGVSLGPVRGPAQSQEEEVTPGCRLMEKVRWVGLGLLTCSHQMAFQCPRWPPWGLGAENWGSAGSCPIRARTREQSWGSLLREDVSCSRSLAVPPS